MAARAARLAAAQAAAAAAGAPAAPVDASHGDAGGDEACPERLSANVFTKYEYVAPPTGETTPLPAAATRHKSRVGAFCVP